MSAEKTTVAPPIYLALDVWMALGLSVREFDGYYERNGWADTWSALLDAVRRRSNLARCELFADREHCVLLANHIGPCMGQSDVGRGEPLPRVERRRDV